MRSKTLPIHERDVLYSETAPAHTEDGILSPWAPTHAETHDKAPAEIKEVFQEDFHINWLPAQTPDGIIFL